MAEMDKAPAIIGVNQSLESLERDFNRLKRQKAKKQGGIEGRVLLNLGFVSKEHYISYRDAGIYTEPREDNKLYLMLDMIGPRLGKLLGRLSSVAGEYKAVADRKDPKALSEAEVVDRLIRALDHKLVQPSKTWEILWWMAVAGTAFEYVPWVPNSTIEPMPKYSPDGQLLYQHTQTGEVIPEQQIQAMTQAGLPVEGFELTEEVKEVGEVGSEILGPLNVFVDHSVKSIADMAPDQRVHVAKIRTIGWIEDTFGIKVEPQRDIQIVTTKFFQTGDSISGNYLRDLIPLVQGSCDDSDPEQAVVIETYAPPSKKNPHGRYECWVPGQQILHSDESPYEEIPLVDFHWKPVTTTFWTDDYVSALIPAQRFINRRVSQLGEQSNAGLYSPILLGPGMSMEDIPTDYPGGVKNGLNDQGAPQVSRLEAPQLPQWFLDSIDVVMKMFNDIAGGADLFEESRFPGQLRGPMAVPLLQEILDTEWGPLYQHIGERMAKVKQMRLNRVKEFYPPKRTLHYVDRDMKDEVLDFHTDRVLRGSLNFNITVERGSLLPELRALREARVMERLNSPLSILYYNERTGMLDKEKIATDLKFGDTGRESRESQYRKLGGQIVEMIWQGKQPPPVLPFYDHEVMMDELESAMATMEFLEASPQIQLIFSQRWEAHRQYLVQAAMQQQQAMLDQMSHSAAAQAAAQTAATTASQTATEVQHQRSADRAVAASSQGQKPGAGPKKRSLTIREES